MALIPFHRDSFGFEQDEVKGFSRSAAEIEWLVLILVLIYLVVDGPSADARLGILMALFFFAAFVLAFHYATFYRQETRWKLAIETWVMIGFITWIVWLTGKLESPLLNLYLLTIITSALTLGKVTTLLEMGLITVCYLFLGYSASEVNLFALTYWSGLLARITPMLLVAYLTTMLSADIRYALSRIKLLSETDELTGLPNMRAFSPLLERESVRSLRYSHPYSILMVDSDNLKQVNDTYGHEAGNRLLRHVVHQIHGVLRAADVMARYGGDEFIVLLPETDAAGARGVAERMHEALKTALFSVNGKVVTATVSVGISSYPDHGEDVQRLVEKADQAMYQSKERGRNTYTAYAVD